MSDPKSKDSVKSETTSGKTPAEASKNSVSDAKAEKENLQNSSAKSSAVPADAEKTAKDSASSKDSSKEKTVTASAEKPTQQKDSKEKASSADKPQQKESKEVSTQTSEQKASVKSETEQKTEQKEEQKTAQKPEQKKEESVKLNSLFAFKVGMTNVYEKNQRVPVTVLQYKTARVTQIKTKEKDGYTAVQTALESSKKASKALQGHLKKAGFKNKAVYVREVRGSLPEGVQEGREVSIESLQKGDQIFVSGISKGHGFAGVVKRWGFGGGPASHGAEKHRTTGSIANTATQGRVFPGKKMPGHFGCDRITQKSRVVDVLPDQSAILVQGPVPGSKNSLIEIRKQEALK